MKNVFIIGFLFLGAIAMAQPGPYHAQGHQGEKHEKMKDLTPQQRATLKTKRMTLDLDLTLAQQEEIQKLNEAMEAKTEAFRKERESGQELSKDELFAKKSQKLDNEIFHKQQLKTILTEDQFAKWEKVVSSRKERGRNMKKKKGQ